MYAIYAFRPRWIQHTLSNFKFSSYVILVTFLDWWFKRTCSTTEAKQTQTIGKRHSSCVMGNKLQRLILSKMIFPLNLNDDGNRYWDNTLECRYNTFHFITILHTALRWQQQYINQTSHSQQTPIPRPHGRAMGCLLWDFEEDWLRYNSTALYLIRWEILTFTESPHV